jgi:hypothetical protein
VAGFHVNELGGICCAVRGEKNLMSPRFFHASCTRSQ